MGDRRLSMWKWGQENNCFLENYYYYYYLARCPDAAHQVYGTGATSRIWDVHKFSCPWLPLMKIRGMAFVHIKPRLVAPVFSPSPVPVSPQSGRLVEAVALGFVQPPGWLPPSFALNLAPLVYPYLPTDDDVSSPTDDHDPQEKGRRGALAVPPQRQNQHPEQDRSRALPCMAGLQNSWHYPGPAPGEYSVLLSRADAHRRSNQDKTGSEDSDSVQLSEYCFNMCEALKTAIQGMDLSESMRMKLKELERFVG